METTKNLQLLDLPALVLHFIQPYYETKAQTTEALSAVRTQKKRKYERFTLSETDCLYVHKKIFQFLILLFY